MKGEGNREFSRSGRLAGTGEAAMEPGCTAREGAVGILLMTMGLS